MNDKIEPKTEHPKTEQTDDELAVPLPTDGKLCLVDNELLTNVNIQQQLHIKDTTVTTSQYVISERSWDSHAVNPPILSTEIVVHGSHNEGNNSTSVDTLIDSDVEIKPPTDDNKKSDENSNPDYEYVFCVAAICRTAPNISELLAISKIDANIKVDLKSDGSSLNGYAADHSSSSSNSTICHIEEPFLVPKVPRDSFMSLSSSGSSNVVPLHHTKSKSNNILLSKNVYTYSGNFKCYKCSHTYSGVSGNFNTDCKDFKTKSEIKTGAGKSKQKKRPKQQNNNFSSKKTKKISQSTENIFDDETSIKIEGLENNDMPSDAEKNQITNAVSFDIGNKVLAYWVADKMFYPATIIDILPPKYKVEFMSDSVIKSVNADGLVHSEALKQGSVIAIFDTVSQEYRVGDIVSINDVPNGEKSYTIDLESETVVVPFEKLVLDCEKAKLLQDKNLFKNYHRLSLSNVSEGKRVRTTNTRNESSKRKKTKQDMPGTSKKRKCLFPEKSDARNIPSTSTGITESSYDIPIRNTTSDSEFDHIREDLTNIKMNQLRNSDIDSEHYSSPEKNGSPNMKPPANKVGLSKKVFKDLHFVLTYAKFKRIPTANDSDQCSDNELTYLSELDHFQPSKLHKKHMENIIKKHGGVVYEYVNLIPKSYYKSSYIISDTPSQTCNFMLGLSVGIPTYHHKYIQEATYQEKPFPEFLADNNIQPIPNGWCVETRTIVFRSPETDHENLFSGYIIYLALDDDDKSTFVESILKFCGAIVYTSWANGVCLPLTRHTTVIVTDEHCPPVLARAKVPKLSLYWVVQCLITESIRPINGHESYIAINDEDDDDEEDD